MYIFSKKNNFQEKHVKLINQAYMYAICMPFCKVFRNKIQVSIFMIPDSKRSIVYTSFIFAGRLSQIFKPKYLILSISQFTLLVIGRIKSNQLLRLYWSWDLKGKFMLQYLGPCNYILYILYILMVKALKFLW